MLLHILINHETLFYWISSYGSLAIFCLLALGIFALPIPDETLILLTGILLSQDRLAFFPAVPACYIGALCGISLSFFVGAMAGSYLIRHYGGWFGFTESKRAQVHDWFRRYGKWALVFGYFIPGLRHITGLTAGMGMLEFSQFALYAYTGAFLWTFTFLSLGYFLGDYAVNLFERVEGSVDLYIIILLVLLLCFIAVQQYRRRE